MIDTVNMKMVIRSNYITSLVFARAFYTHILNHGHGCQTLKQTGSSIQVGEQINQIKIMICSTRQTCLILVASGTVRKKQTIPTAFSLTLAIVPPLQYSSPLSIFFFLPKLHSSSTSLTPFRCTYTHILKLNATSYLGFFFLFCSTFRF